MLVATFLELLSCNETHFRQYGLDIFSGTVLEDDDTVELPCFVDNCDPTSAIRPMTRHECCVVSSGLSYFGVSGCTLCVGKHIAWYSNVFESLLTKYCQYYTSS